MTTPICLACRANPSTTITEDGWTPLCGQCCALVGAPLTIGERAVCHIGSIQGTVVGFDESVWAESGLAEIDHTDGTTGWYPLAELAPAV